MKFVSCVKGKKKKVFISFLFFSIFSHFLLLFLSLSILCILERKRFHYFFFFISSTFLFFLSFCVPEYHLWRERKGNRENEKIGKKGKGREGNEMKRKNSFPFLSCV